MEASWKQISSKRAYHSPFVSVDEDEVTRPDGSEGIYYTVHMRDGVGVIACENGKILLVGQYRYPLRKRIWGFVAGGVEHHDNPQRDAERELQEEAGYAARDWRLLGTFPYSPSLSNQKSYVYLAQELTSGQHSREAGEADMETGFFSPEEIDKLIASGEFSAFDISDFYLFKKFLEKQPK